MNRIEQLEKQTIEDDEDNEDDDEDSSFLLEEITNSKGDMIGFVSSSLLNEEFRIRPLPKTMLPAAHCGNSSSYARSDVDKLKKRESPHLRKTRETWK